MQHKSKHGKLLEVEVFGHSIVYLNKECMLLICNDVSDRKEIEVKITKAIIQAQEEERFQMGAELHDNICQLLAYAQMNMGMMKKDIGQMGGKWFEQASGSVQEALESVRSVSHQLAPAFLRDRPLKDAMLMLLEGFTSSGKLTFSYDYDERLNELNFDLDRKLNLYRILQEQLRNIDKHSGATSVAISLQIAQGELQMRIMDNGHGFDKALVFSGIGFANIKRRAELFGGAFQVESTPGNGCEIFVSMKIS
jgi:signal transduction histidine kinase